METQLHLIQGNNPKQRAWYFTEISELWYLRSRSSPEFLKRSPSPTITQQKF